MLHEAVLLSFLPKQHTLSSSLQITLLHLKTVRRLLSDPIVQHAVDVVEVRIRSLYDSLPLGQWRLVRQTVCRFFQNRRIKVGSQLAQALIIWTKRPCHQDGLW